MTVLTMLDYLGSHIRSSLDHSFIHSFIQSITHPHKPARTSLSRPLNYRICTQVIFTFPTHPTLTTIITFATRCTPNPIRSTRANGYPARRTPLIQQVRCELDRSHDPVIICRTWTVFPFFSVQPCPTYPLSRIVWGGVGFQRGSLR